MVSEFFSALSGHLEALFDESRWLSSGPYLSIKERTEEIQQLLSSLEMPGMSPNHMAYLRKTVQRTFSLAEDYCRHVEEGAPTNDVRRDIEQWQAMLDRRAEL
jgi:hypothetical protein